MLVSKFKFCKEVIGSGCTGKSTAFLNAKLDGWNVPYIKEPGVGDCVDVVHLPMAVEAYAAEVKVNPPKHHNGEQVQLIASRMAELEDKLNKFTTEQIRWNGVFGSRLDQVTPTAIKKRRR